ncbi:MULTISPECIES: ABC transporter permease [Sulfitobacter]|jgi:putative spermidine/putrescine transport system permease protein|uniref:ABC transporter permease n=1 Tax=Sulfitobacter sp. TCYB15 TaxID=3229275 RepID=A0AAU8C366_9RHOB|nr:MULTISPECIES: ABC transporter permease [Sulfitobacter]MAB15651.1 ABC transporter permease [Roseobacter sp.]AXI49609.1 ABC transporter permease [Sulfitobacter sp. SK025]EAP82372.1 polyamine ABC transporter, permease protein [Sulfitobacter sp. NAS-14.1]EAP85580.1 polyamine ABC transporter, permease protein [Sulfitobacter sp. EE-36]QLL41247.1 ABC transporter permease [Sulfitobacter pontiacus]|tara:strand:- start:1223 stop:2890 length:1668 start_codon:yes stop_codon:yes gene_type:complete
MSDTADATNDTPEQTGPMLAADGTPLKRSLNRALRRQKLSALLLIAPLLIFILITFIAPIADMLFRSVENQIVSDTLPRTTQTLSDWDSESGETPGAPVYKALYEDLFIAQERKLHTRLGSRLNYELTGASSLFRKSGRGVDDIGEVFQDQFEDLNDFWKKGENWNALLGSDAWLAEISDWKKSSGDDQPAFEMREGMAELLPETAEYYEIFADFVQNDDEDNLYKEDPWALIYSALYDDLTGPTASQIASYSGPASAELTEAAAAAPTFDAVDYKTAFTEIDDDWGKTPIWSTIRAYSPALTNGYFLNAVDMQKTADGPEFRPDNERIYGTLFLRTLFMSVCITLSCILLGYPVAWILANLPARTANLLMILVLLPFWTSLLVRTSAWKVMLQQQGVINDTLVWLGLVADDSRLALINNQTGTIIAMTHILLPFMILPLYSVMQTVPPSYLRAAKSLGATNWTAFWRVYFPQSVPGIGAGSILVFILSIGYYITPEIVGGTTGTFISNRIAYHISSSLNWGLAAALGAILLAVVLGLYWAYDKIVGIDNVKLGG